MARAGHATSTELVARRGTLCCVLLVATAHAVGCKGNTSGTNTSAAEGAQTPPAQVGSPVVIGDLSWTVVEAFDRGQSLPAEQGDPIQTQGRFLLVHFRVLNNGTKETDTLHEPDVLDPKGRHFPTLRDEGEHLPPGADTLYLSHAPPGIPQDYWSLYEVPGGVPGGDGLQVLLPGGVHVALGVLKPMKSPGTPVITASPQAQAGQPATRDGASCARGDQGSCSRACAAGDLLSCETLGELLVASEDSKCATPLQKACDGSVARACTTLGSRCLQLAAAPDEQAAAAATRGCDLSDGAGCLALAADCDKGTGIARDAAKADAALDKALTLLPKQCDGGDARSCLMLGTLSDPTMKLKLWQRVPKNKAKAASFYSKACASTGPDAAAKKAGCANAKDLGG